MIADRAAVAWIAVGVATRLAAAGVLGGDFHFIDETVYVDAARRLLAGAGFGAGYANVPAQPVLLALLAAPRPASLAWLRLAHAVATGLAGGLALAVLGARVAGPRATRFALALYACDPLLVIASGLLYPEAAAAAVLTAALAAAVTAPRRDDARTAARAGLLLGVTALFRPVAIVLLPLLAAWPVATAAARPARRLALAGVLALACGAGLAPWVVHNLARDGGVLPAGMAGLQHAPVARRDIARQGLAASLAHEARHDAPSLARRVRRELWHFFEPFPLRLTTDDPRKRAALHRLDARLPTEPSFPRGLRDAASGASYALEMVLALAGLALAGRARRPALVLLAAVALVYGLGYALFVAKLRYRIVVMPGLLVIAGCGAEALWARLRRDADAPEPVGERDRVA